MTEGLPRRQRRAGWIAGATALLQVAAFLPYLLSTLIAPPAAVLLLWGLWLVLVLLAVLVHRRNPPLSLAVPGVTVLVGIASLLLGTRYLGWQG